MNRIYERCRFENAVVPVSLAASTASTSMYIDGKDCNGVDFIVSFGAIAENKKLTLELRAADDAQGTGAETRKTVEITAPSGGIASDVAVISADVHGKRFYTVSVSHDNSDAVPLSVLAAASVRCRPAENRNVADAEN